jgi:DNA ligase-1
MQRFTQLYSALDRTTKTLEKTALLRAYLEAAPAEDAAWALFFLTGRKLPRAVNTRLMREAVSAATGLPPWLVEECYDVVGDLAETLALLVEDVPAYASGPAPPLHVLVEEHLRPLKELEDAEKVQRMQDLWHSLNRGERFLWNKFITGGFRVGVSRGLVARALAEVAGVDAAVIAHRLMGEWEPSAAWMQTLLSGEREEDPGKPYPFYLASPLEQPVEALAPFSRWQLEWKWDGIRAQVLRRQGETLLWSRGEELMTDRFPEITEASASLPDGTVLDGEILAWEGEGPMPFLSLQRRIGRKRIGPKLLEEVPVIFMAYDQMEQDGKDLREQPLHARRAILERTLQQADSNVLKLSPCLSADSGSELTALREASREKRVEGLMIKQVDSPYRAGRKRGEWWKWKVDPYEVDAVLTYAQKGHGRRAGLFSDYTFGLWKDGELVTFAKAYSGLTDEEIRQVDRFVRGNTLERFGPVRRVKPELVFQIACEGIQRSSRHKSGIAVRFPRMVRWRQDKTPEDANTLEDVLRLLPTEEKQ